MCSVIIVALRHRSIEHALNFNIISFVVTPILIIVLIFLHDCQGLEDSLALLVARLFWI